MAASSQENGEKFNAADYPFENLVLEGGGNKGLAYVGAIKVLEKAGILKNIKRFCGASAGSMVAALLAVGYNADEIEKFMGGDLRKIFFDNSWGYLSIIPNLFYGYGWNPGKKLLDWFTETLKKKTGKENITFGEVYKEYGMELCIVVTNVNQMMVEYFHPKTTPEVSVSLAVRMSSSLPGVFQGVWHRSSRTHEAGDDDDIYVDGGLICNYPIHAFDGWWLSMKSEDSFFKRFPGFSNLSEMFSTNKGRFAGKNMKTLGLMLYSHSDVELMKDELEKRMDNDFAKPPANSKLYRERRQVKERKKEADVENEKIMKSMQNFLKEISDRNYHDDGIVDLDELRQVFKNSVNFTEEDQRNLFDNMTTEEAFMALDVNGDGKVTFKELMDFVERKGVNLRTKYMGFSKKKVKNLGDFLYCIQEALCVNIKRLYVEPSDVERTIGIDTDYIETTDFELEQCDKDFLIESGEKAAMAFLRYHSAKKVIKNEE